MRTPTRKGMAHLSVRFFPNSVMTPLSVLYFPFSKATPRSFVTPNPRPGGRVVRLRRSMAANPGKSTAQNALQRVFSASAIPRLPQTLKTPWRAVAAVLTALTMLDR